MSKEGGKSVDKTTPSHSPLVERLVVIASLWVLVEDAGYNHAYFRALQDEFDKVGELAKQRGLDQLCQQAVQLKNYFQQVDHRAVNNQLSILSQQVQTFLDAAYAEAAVTIETMLASSYEQLLIYAYDDDTQYLKDIGNQLARYGYSLEQFDELTAFADAVRKKKPSVVLMGLNDPAQYSKNIDVIKALKTAKLLPAPIMYLAENDSFITRLDAVRGFGQDYFIKPIDIADLVERLEALTPSSLTEPFRILILESDSELGVYFYNLLKSIGVICYLELSPSCAIETIKQFRPDLIVLDMNLSTCTGLELTMIIRQCPEFMTIPIVFLSNEKKDKLPSLSSEIGADDFLLKPVDPELLIHTVVNKTRRARYVKSIMERDPLTGLLVHTKITEHLDIQLDVSRRHKRPLSYALLDIDHFKDINDYHGHLVGDKVIRYLSSLLKVELRRSDIVCRYGGEEFAIIFSETDIDKAREVIDRLRAQFNQRIFSVDGQTFNPSFSAGVACYPDYDSIDELMQAADDAMYMAKSKGRNCVVVLRNR